MKKYLSSLLILLLSAVAMTSYADRDHNITFISKFPYPVSVSTVPTADPASGSRCIQKVTPAATTLAPNTPTLLTVRDNDSSHACNTHEKDQSFRFTTVDGHVKGAFQYAHYKSGPLRLWVDLIKAKDSRKNNTNFRVVTAQCQAGNCLDRAIINGNNPITITVGPSYTVNLTLTPTNNSSFSPIAVSQWANEIRANLNATYFGSGYLKALILHYRADSNKAVTYSVTIQ